jgi:hypothetical protein
MAKNDVHVVPHDDRWAVTKEGNQRPSQVTDTQREAIEVGREIAKRESSELNIHGRDGQIRDKNSYGNDPYPPKG